MNGMSMVRTVASWGWRRVSPFNSIKYTGYLPLRLPPGLGSSPLLSSVRANRIQLSSATKEHEQSRGGVRWLSTNIDFLREDVIATYYDPKHPKSTELADYLKAQFNKNKDDIWKGLRDYRYLLERNDNVRNEPGIKRLHRVQRKNNDNRRLWKSFLQKHEAKAVISVFEYEEVMEELLKEDKLTAAMKVIQFMKERTTLSPTKRMLQMLLFFWVPKSFPEAIEHLIQKLEQNELEYSDEILSILIYHYWWKNDAQGLKWYTLFRQKNVLPLNYVDYARLIALCYGTQQVDGVNKILEELMARNIARSDVIAFSIKLCLFRNDVEAATRLKEDTLQYQKPASWLYTAFRGYWTRQCNFLELAKLLKEMKSNDVKIHELTLLHPICSAIALDNLRFVRVSLDYLLKNYEIVNLFLKGDFALVQERANLTIEFQRSIVLASMLAAGEWDKAYQFADKNQASEVIILAAHYCKINQIEKAEALAASTGSILAYGFCARSALVSGDLEKVKRYARTVAEMEPIPGAHLSFYQILCDHYIKQLEANQTSLQLIMLQGATLQFDLDLLKLALVQHFQDRLSRIEANE